MRQTIRMLLAGLAALVILAGSAPLQTHSTPSDVHREFAGPDWPEGG
jgi:hypothetical protein